MLRWLDHAQVEGIGGIIDHFYTEFGPNLEAVSLRSLEGAHYCNTGMPSLIIHRACIRLQAFCTCISPSCGTIGFAAAF